MKRIVVFGGGGFIGHNLVNRLKSQNHYVVAVDLKQNQFGTSKADRFILADLRSQERVKSILSQDFDELYQFAADMGGAGYVFTGLHDADILQNSTRINLNVLEALKINTTIKIFYASSACIYPEENQQDTKNPNCTEASAYPANPDSDYGWEKLYSERLYQSYARNYGLDIRIARLHNVFGPYGIFDGGKEKAPAAICRKVIRAKDGESIEIWGDGQQSRSFLFIDECLEGIERLMQSSYNEPLNIGSSELVSINNLAQLIISVGNKDLKLKHIEGPQGVRGRCSDNVQISRVLDWEPQAALSIGITLLYNWIYSEI